MYIDPIYRPIDIALCDVYIYTYVTCIGIGTIKYISTYKQIQTYIFGTRIETYIEG